MNVLRYWRPPLTTIVIQSTASCPTSVYTCMIWGSKQIAIFFLNSISWLFLLWTTSLFLLCPYMCGCYVLTKVHMRLWSFSCLFNQRNKHEKQRKTHFTAHVATACSVRAFEWWKSAHYRKFLQPVKSVKVFWWFSCVLEQMLSWTARLSCSPSKMNFKFSVQALPC